MYNTIITMLPKLYNHNFLCYATQRSRRCYATQTVKYTGVSMLHNLYTNISIVKLHNLYKDAENFMVRTL